MSFLPFLHKLIAQQSLTTGEARQAMSLILSGEASTAQIAAFAVALRMKGETVGELKGLAEAMRASGVKVEHGITAEPVLDTCGTGGDSQGTLNVSTIVAFVVAGAGVRVAKHGNRSLSSKCGSADLIEALGAKLLTDAAEIGRAIREVGFGFLFAPVLHPAMKHAQPARAEIRTRTAFNLLGPLANPAGATCQLVGAPSVEAAEMMAGVLAGFGLERGFVVHGADGLDEFSTTGVNDVFEIRDGAVTHSRMECRAFGLPQARLEDLRGGEIDVNARLALEVLKGKAGPCRDIVIANASLGLMAAGKAAEPLDAAGLAAESIDSGAAHRKLTEYCLFTRDAG